VSRKRLNREGEKMGRTVSRILINLLFPFLFCVLQNDRVTFGAEPIQEPILRIETGMHTAVIGRIGIDAENRYLVTGSQDKTVRVWEAASGRLIKTIRPPIGGGNEGIVNAVAISPDGMTIVCGGQTSVDGG
jgi:hypothetical protein